MSPKEFKSRVCCWISICVLVLLFSHIVLAQASSPSGKPIFGGQQSQDSSVVVEFAKVLQEEEKSHREYLERLYTRTEWFLGILIAVGIGIIGYAQFKTRKDVEEAVNARFTAIVNKGIQRRITKLTDQLNEFEQILNSLRDDARDVRLLAADTRSLVENKPAEAESEMKAKIQEESIRQVSVPPLDKDELEILGAIGKSKYSLRTDGGIIQEAAMKGIDADRTIRSLRSLTQKEFIGETRGKSGGIRWYITETGRKLL